MIDLLELICLAVIFVGMAAIGKLMYDDGYEAGHADAMRHVRDWEESRRHTNVR